jgi:Kef-type K+ transport system membrane component KefB
MLLHVLLILAVVMILGRVLGRACAWISQPPVIGEVVAGILLGPSLLGWVWPVAKTFLLPKDVEPYLGVIAQLGVILFMFLVGLELNLQLLRAKARQAGVISLVSIVVPFGLGLALAGLLYPSLAGSPEVGFVSFALFLGLALSITAFPVLARILTDRGMSRTPLGVLALLCAAADDATAWCLLAFVMGVAQANVTDALRVVALTLGYVAVMFVLVQPVAARLATKVEGREIGQGVVAAALAGLLLSALTTEAIGIHPLFGAFLFGAVIPHESTLARALTRKLYDLVTVLLLPAFFALAGMRMEMGLLVDLQSWLLCGLIILAATLGKFGGSFVAARLTGMGWRDAAALGVLMNTRGLMELIVLNIGYELHVISPKLYTMMVLMALATTFATTPILQRLRQARGADSAGPDEARARESSSAPAPVPP